MRLLAFGQSTGILCATLGKTLGAASSAQLNANATTILPRRTIVTKWALDLPYNYPEPWPYKDRNFSRLLVGVNPTKKRFHVNTKLIVVEGNIASGKTAFAEQLADELGFYHMKQFMIDELFVDRYGNDFRKFYHLFPERFRIPDMNMFFKDPAADGTAVMQDMIFESRWEQYMNALAHLFNTGQGVVLERSPYSDFVFANAMREKDWISKEYFHFYNYKRKTTLPWLQLEPHLMIYLDCPPEKCMENIQKRGNPDEIAAVDMQYLNTIAESYKDLIRETEADSFVLSYDWTTPEQMDVVVEDIEKINFEFHEWHSGDQLQRWFLIGEDYNYGWKRYLLTDKTYLMSRAFKDLEHLKYEVAELYVYPPDGTHYRNVVMHEVLKDPYTHGYTKYDKEGRQKGMLRCNLEDSEMPESWTEYFWKEKHIGGIVITETHFDPFGKTYNPDYLKHL